jgi:hypothetical protein
MHNRPNQFIPNRYLVNRNVPKTNYISHRDRKLHYYNSNIAIIPSSNGRQIVVPQFNPHRRFIEITRPSPIVVRIPYRLHVKSNLSEGNKQVIRWIVCLFIICASFWMTGGEI